MTINDLILRLKNAQEEMRCDYSPQVKLGRDYNDADNPFDYFNVKIVDGSVILIPSDVWGKK
jgi:hypothetical protein